MFKKLAQYVLVIIAIGLIIYLTMMQLDVTMDMSESFKNVMIAIADWFGAETSPEWWNTSSNIRLIGHVIEYFVLGLIVGYVIKRKLIGLIICAAVSFADQIVKSYVPARHFDKGDIPFDVIGFCSGLAIAWVIRYTIRKLKDPLIPRTTMS